MPIGTLLRIFGVFFFSVILAASSGTRAAGVPDSVSSTYQIDPAHDGAVTFSKPFAPPLKMLWSVDLGGPISYPVVVGNLVIVIADGPIGTHVVALNTATGKPVWQKIISGDFSSSYIASDNGMLFLTTFNGPFQAFNAATGKSLWSAQLPDQLFFDFVPVAADGYVYTGGDESGTDVYKLNESTGAVVWKHTLIGGGRGPTLGDGKVFLPMPCNVPAFDAVTGRQIWYFYDGCDGGGGEVAAYFHGLLYAPDVNIGSGVVLNGHTGKSVGSLSGHIPAFYKLSSYGISGSSLVATSISTGNLKWFFTRKDTFSNPPIVINGNVYTLSDQGNLYVNGGQKGGLLQSFKIGLGSESSIAQGPSSGLGAGNGMLFVPSGSKLAAFSP
jgi:outer membrane protein assembly factor BamB